MNCKQAKSIQLTDIIDKLGFKPYKSYMGGGELCYLSPFRTETTPSFFINKNDNTFFDFGESIGDKGSIKYLDFSNTSHSVADALRFLTDLGFSSDHYTKPLFSFEKQNNIPSKNVESDGIKDLCFVRAGEVEHPAIFWHLNGEAYQTF